MKGDQNGRFSNHLKRKKKKLDFHLASIEKDIKYELFVDIFEYAMLWKRTFIRQLVNSKDEIVSTNINYSICSYPTSTSYI